MYRIISKMNNIEMSSNSKTITVIDDKINLKYDKLLMKGKLIFKENIEENEEKMKRLSKDREIKERCLKKLIYELKNIIIAIYGGNFECIDLRYRLSFKSVGIEEIDFPTEEEIRLNNKFKNHINDILETTSAFSDLINRLKGEIDWAIQMLKTPEMIQY